MLVECVVRRPTLPETPKEVPHSPGRLTGNDARLNAALQDEVKDAGNGKCVVVKYKRVYS